MSFIITPFSNSRNNSISFLKESANPLLKSVAHDQMIPNVPENSTKYYNSDVKPSIRSSILLQNIIQETKFTNYSYCQWIPKKQQLIKFTIFAICL